MKLLEILGVLGLNIDFYGLKALFPSGYLPTTNGGKVKNSLKNNMKKKLVYCGIHANFTFAISYDLKSGLSPGAYELVYYGNME